MFTKIDLRLKKRKLYLFYLNIIFLEIKVDAFKFIIAKEKLKIITNFIFSINLAKFK